MTIYQIARETTWFLVMIFVLSSVELKDRHTQAAMHDRIETNVFIQQFQHTEFNKDVNNLCLEMFSFWLLTIFVLVLTVAIFIPYLNY